MYKAKLNTKIFILQERARMLALARAFFAERGILEVDCGALVKNAPIDSNIDVIEASVSSNEQGFLHTSPEYAMKRLLADGTGDIYYLGHVFRKGEIGRFHSPEFTMAEWYRIQMPFADLIDETCEFLFLFFGKLPTHQISYREAFASYVGIDYSKASLNELNAAASRFSIHLPPNISAWDRETYLHLLLTHVIEPKLGKGELTILTDYPPNEAALACLIEKNGEWVAERFEIYFEGVELTNGYHELANAQELRSRFHEENNARKSQGKETYRLDEKFLGALQNNFPDCCGVSVGFDRALLLKTKSQSIQDVLPFSWDEA
ncbi:MAG: EF-P lysine aminoacylase EpmA [Chlamydiota bacterium]